MSAVLHCCADSTYKTSILSLYTFSFPLGLSVSAKMSSQHWVPFFTPSENQESKQRKRCLTWNELHRQVKLLAVAGLLPWQSVVQRHHLAGSGNCIGYMKLELPVWTNLY